MSRQEIPADAARPTDSLSATEARLAAALVLIHRALPRLEEPSRTQEVQTALRQAAVSIESARRSHQEAMDARKSTPLGSPVENEIVAIISAAVAVVLARPYRVVSVQPSPVAVPYLNVWALEGRTQIFQSHKIR